MPIVSISGKIGSGKDTVGKMIKLMLESPSLSNEGIVTLMGKNAGNDDDTYYPKWKIKKFADKLKDIVCLLLGCTREQLEDREFKEKELGKEWWYYKDKQNNDITAYHDFTDVGYEIMYHLIKLTPRTLLQLLGTECGRKIIHPDIWVNALMSEYKPSASYQGTLLDLGMSNEQMEKIGDPVEAEYPRWIITDTRFPNEFRAIKKRRKSFLLRIERDVELRYPDLWKEFQAQESIDSWDDFLISKNMYSTVYHPSETALDEIPNQGIFIENNGSLLELASKIRKVLSDYYIV